VRVEVHCESNLYSELVDEWLTTRPDRSTKYGTINLKFSIYLLFKFLLQIGFANADFGEKVEISAQIQSYNLMP
jgi:hypothetical protein